MNELTIEVNNIARREASLKTAEGQKRATGMMLNVLRVIEAAGYEPKSDLAEMAVVWVNAMKEQIAVYRFEIIEKAVLEYIQTDTREYKQFPSVGQIIDICNRIGKNPKAELAKREQEERERQMIAERDEELAALPKDYKARCMERFGYLWKERYENRGR